jgi:hypothetical protein
LYDSNALVKINDNTVVTFYETQAEIYGLAISDSTISSSVTDTDLTLDVTGTANVAIVPPARITNSTISSDPTTGALVVTGGVGIGNNLNVSGDIAGNDINLSGTTLLQFQESDPTSNSSGVTIYTKDSELGVSGVYFVNNTTQGQLISKSKALAYSIIFG